MSETAQTHGLVIAGRRMVGGCAEGEALVSHQPISGWGGVNPREGTIIELHHELRGQSFAGKVLVFPSAKGSSGWSSMFHLARVIGVAPAAMLVGQVNTKAALAAVVSHVPAMTDFDRDPVAFIDSGDWVRVDADRGVVEVTKK